MPAERERAFAEKRLRGVFPHFFVARELAEGRLVKALPEYEMPALSISTVYASRRNLLPKVRAFVDFLAEHLTP